MEVRELGAGCFGRVYALRIRASAVAIKAGSARNESELSCLWALRQARVPHTVYALAALRNAGPPLLPEPCELAIAMTRVAGVTLREHLVARCVLGQTLPLDMVIKWTAQLVDFLSHMHTRLGLAHEDLKLGNIMVEHGTLDLRVIDFTFAGRRRGDEWQCGTVCYMAPERLFMATRPVWATQEGPDVWAVGTLLATLILSGQPLATGHG
jgi:serine/threonine protein kinase